MDKTDRLLLQKLQRDASLSVNELAEATSISKSACWRRLQKLQSERVIKGRVTLVDAAAVDLPITVFISIKTNQHNAQWAKRFRAVVESIPNILEVYRMGGEVDYLAKAVVQDLAGYDRLYQQLIEVELFDVTASFVMEEIKHSTALPL